MRLLFRVIPPSLQLQELRDVVETIETRDRPTTDEYIVVSVRGTLESRPTVRPTESEKRGEASGDDTDRLLKWLSLLLR